MITQTSAVNFRQNLGEMLNQVQYRHDSVVISKDGKPVAALVDAQLFARIRRMQGRFDALCQRIEAGFASVPEAEGMAEIDAAIAQDRAQTAAANPAPAHTPRFNPTLNPWAATVLRKIFCATIAKSNNSNRSPSPNSSSSATF